MDRILYATDCSEHTSVSMRYAMNFAHTTGANLHILYVYTLPPIDNATLRSHEQIKQYSEAEHLEVLKKYSKRYCGDLVDKTKHEIIVDEHNSISSCILEKSELLDADLVIVGRKDKQSKRGLLAGNIANMLMEKLNCPLLVVPNHSENHRSNTMIYASDFEADDVLALGQLHSLAEKIDADIHVVHIPVQNEYSSSQQMEWFKELVVQKMGETGIEFHLLISSDVADGLQSFIDKTNAGFLCMLERNEKGFISKLFSGDTVKKMKSMCEPPMLIFNRQSIA